MKCNNSDCQTEVHMEENTNIINGTYIEESGAATDAFVVCRECYWKVIHYLQGCSDYDFVLKETK